MISTLIYEIINDSFDVNYIRCRFIQCGYENENKEFCGVIVDYQGGGITDIEFWHNGKILEDKGEFEDYDEYEIFVELNPRAEEIYDYFRDMFLEDENSGCFYILKTKFNSMFVEKQDSNYYVMKNDINITPVSSHRGLTLFR